MPAKPRRQSVSIRAEMKGPTSPVARPAMAFFVAMGVVDLTLDQPSRTVFMSFDAPMLATQEFTRMQRRPSNTSAISGRRSSRTSRSARILPPPTTVTLMKQARSASSSRYFSPYLWPPMPPASVHQSPASLVALIPLLLALDVVLAANPLFSCMLCKCCKSQPTAQFSLLPSKV
jgi:hypothetical protein